MVTSFPYYPSWEKRPEDGGRLYRIDKIEGVSVHRCWHFVPKSVSTLKRIFHEGKFRPHLHLARAFSSARRCLCARFSSTIAWGGGMARRENQRRAVCFSCAGYATGRRRRAWDAEGELVYPGLVCARIVRLSACGAASPASRRACLRVFGGREFPKPSSSIFQTRLLWTMTNQPPERGEFRRRHGFAPGEFLAIYAGNLGVKQGLEVLLETAPLLRDPRIRIVICGDGAQRESLGNGCAS